MDAGPGSRTRATPYARGGNSPRAYGVARDTRLGGAPAPGCSAVVDSAVVAGRRLGLGAGRDASAGGGRYGLRADGAADDHGLDELPRARHLRLLQVLDHQ